MIFTAIPLIGAYIVEIKKIEDDRGFFGRSFCKKEFGERGLETEMVQGNISFNNKKGTLRGMHYQVAPYEEAKLVRCTEGSLFDVIIDLRPNSPTYKKWYGVELSLRNNKMLYVPKNFAHGFITLEDNTSVQYMVSEFYSPEAERGIKWDDPQFNIQWPIQVAQISEKDNSHQNF